MAVTEFNSFANPTVDTKHFKIYADVSTTGTPEYELQGRGVTSWTEAQNVDTNSEEDVLGYVDFTSLIRSLHKTQILRLEKTRSSAECSLTRISAERAESKISTFCKSMRW